ncbi:hypothetical protein D6810_02685 [Candidatus Dojkabacteria bacterium]|uniref:Uncharacterized protein n=1 Tax=Candidatus Dojkabacteria bacterium TaxID=2099670 RepID=A0A3M0Z092_9BACT|nr:MAG: hypothetical protein D6810_02685 [Candidatus Dojkabacteria bacterium]
MKTVVINIVFFIFLFTYPIIFNQSSLIAQSTETPTVVDRPPLIESNKSDSIDNVDTNIKVQNEDLSDKTSKQENQDIMSALFGGLFGGLSIGFIFGLIFRDILLIKK